MTVVMGKGNDEDRDVLASTGAPTGTSGAIALPDCRAGHAYRVRSRNLGLAVFDGTGGFIGIRTKFGSRFLFTEFHRDTGAPYGTVSPLRDLGPLPSNIEARATLGTIDRRSRRPVRFERTSARTDGRWVYVDEDSARDPRGIEPRTINNAALFNWLDGLESEWTTGQCERCRGTGGRERRSGTASACWSCGGTRRGPVREDV